MCKSVLGTSPSHNPVQCSNCKYTITGWFLCYSCLAGSTSLAVALALIQHSLSIHDFTLYRTQCWPQSVVEQIWTIPLLNRNKWMWLCLVHRPLGEGQFFFPAHFWGIWRITYLENYIHIWRIYLHLGQLYTKSKPGPCTMRLPRIQYVSPTCS